MYRAFFRAFTPTFERQELLIDGDRAVAIERVSGTDHGGVLGMPPTGRSFTILEGREQNLEVQAENDDFVEAE